jgi:hypothetical protein
LKDWRLRSAGALLLVLAACSRSSGGDTPRADGSTPPTAAPLVASAPADATGAGPVLTPEDVEPETEHRITEQNLERELDRLEREIQAE